MTSKMNAKKAQLQKGKGALTPQPQEGAKYVNKGPRSEPPAKKKMMLEAADDSEEEITFEGSGATKLFAVASDSDSEDMDSAAVQIAKVGQKRKITQGPTLTLLGKKSETPVKKNKQSKSPQQIKQLNGQERTPAQIGKAQTSSKSNNLTRTPLTKGQTPVQSTPKGTPGQQKGQKQMPAKKQTPNSKPAVQAEEDLSDEEEEEEEEEEIQLPIKGSNQKQNSAIKVQTPVQTVQKTPGQQKGHKQTLGDKQTPKGRPAVNSEEDLSKEEEMLDEDEEDEEEEEDSDEEEVQIAKVGQKRKITQGPTLTLLGKKSETPVKKNKQSKSPQQIKQLNGQERTPAQIGKAQTSSKSNNLTRTPLTKGQTPVQSTPKGTPGQQKGQKQMPAKKQTPNSKPAVQAEEDLSDEEEEEEEEEEIQLPIKGSNQKQNSAIKVQTPVQTVQKTPGQQKGHKQTLGDKQTPKGRPAVNSEEDLSKEEEMLDEDEEDEEEEEDSDEEEVQIAKVGQKRKITQGPTSTLLGKKSETPVKKNKQSKSPQQIKQLNGQERTPAQIGKAQTPSKSNNLTRTPLTKGQTPVQSTPKGTPGQQKGQKQMPAKKQTPKSKPAVQAEEDLSDEKEEEEEEEEIQLPIKGSNQKQNSAIKVQTPVQTVQKTPGQQKGHKQTLGDKQTPKGRPAVNSEEDLSKEEEMLDEDEEDEEEEEDSDEEEVQIAKVGQKRKITQGPTSTLLGKKSETPVKKNKQSKSPQQIKQLNGQERTPAQIGKAQTPSKSNNLTRTPLTKGQTPVQSTPKGTPGQQKGQKQMPAKKQTPKSKPAVQAEEDLSDEKEEEEEEEEIQLPIKGSNQKQNSAIKVQTPVQTVQKTPGQQKGHKQTLGDKQTPKGRPAVNSEEDLSKEEEMLDEDEEDEEEEEDSDEEEVQIAKVGQKRKITQGPTSTLLGKKSETPVKKNKQSKSPQQIKQLNGQERTPAQIGKAQTPSKSNNLTRTPLTKGQTPVQSTPKGTPGQQKGQKQMPAKKQTPKSKPAVQAEEDLSDEKEEEEEEEEIQLPIKGSNQKQNSAIKVQTPVQTVQKTPGQQKGHKQTLGDKQTPKGRPAVNSEEDLSKEEEMLDEDEEDEEEEEDSDEEEVQIAKVGQKRKITQGPTSTLLGKKSETPVKKNKQSKSPQQIKQLNGQERTPAQIGKAQTPSKSNNLTRTPLTKGQTPVQSTPKGTPGQQKGQKQMPAKKQTPKSKPAVQAEEDLSDEKEEEEEEEEIQLLIKGSNQKQNSAIKVQTPVQTVQKTPGQQKGHKQTLGDKQTPKGRPAVNSEEDLSKEEEMLDEDEEDEEEEEDGDEEEVQIAKVGQKRKTTQGPTSTLLGKKSETPVKKNKQSKSPQQIKQLNGHENSEESEESGEESVVDLKKQKTVQQTQKNKSNESDVEEEDEEEVEEEDEEEVEEEDEEEVEEKTKGKEGKKKNKESAEALPDVEVVTLFCGNIKDNCEAKELGKFFKKNGLKVADVRKPVGKRFAYVDLADASDLKAALALNQSSFQDQKIKVQQARKAKAPNAPKDRFEKEDQECTLFVKNLADSVTEETLGELFSEATEIRIPKIYKSPNGAHKGFAYIQFKDAGVVEKMIKKHQGAELEGQALYLDHVGQKSSYKSPQANKSSGEPGKSKVLFVKNLSYSVTEDKLVDTFEGAVSARIPTFPDTGKPKGFAYIQFKDAGVVEKMIKKHQGAELEGQALYLYHVGQKSSFKSPQANKSSGEPGKSKVLFVKNLSYSVTEDKLVDTFEGAVSARIPTFPDTGKPKGFAFIDFASADAAQGAYDKCQGQDLDGREMRVDFALGKGDRGGRSPGGNFGGRGRGGGRGNFRGGRGGRGGGGNWNRGGRGGRRGGRGGGGDRGFGDKRRSFDSGGSSKSKKVTLDSDSD